MYTTLIKEDIIQNVEFKESFEQLSEEEKNYIYYLSKACWAGQPIVLFQTSYESPALFIIFQLFFSSFKEFSEIKSTLLKNNISDINYNQFIKYAAYFYSNFGNYRLKKKFIPSLNINDFEEILKISPKFGDIRSIWDIIKYIIYDDSDNICYINLEEKEGKNCYYLGGIKKEQILKVDEALIKNNYSLLNTRLFILNLSKVVVLIGSIEEKQVKLNDDIILLYGEYSSFLTKINEFLESAKNVTTKDTEKEIITSYIEFFKDGDIEKHKESQKKWVKENNSSIDFNMGWNETVIDPLGVRGLFESFVGIADNFRSQKYEQFGNLLPQLFTELPWDENFEKDMNSIQFNSLEEICFARNGSPFGKCLPKYYNIKENDGVKNILFFNISNFDYMEDDFFLCNEKDIELINNFGKPATKIIVFIKQLMGYGSGKLLRVEKNNENNEEKSNFNRDLVNPLTGEVINKYYLNNETFEEKFTTNAPVLDECRSLLIGLYFCENENIQELFYVNKVDYKKVTYTIWLLQFTGAILGLNLYNKKNKTWSHPYIQALWIITKYILETQKEGEEIFKINLDEEKETIQVELNKEMVLFLTKEILSKFMLKLHIWKCIGDVENANNCIEHYSEVDEKFLKIKNIIDKKEKERPKTLFLFHNLVRDEEDGTVTCKEYTKNYEGIIESNLDRFGTEYNKDIYNQWVKYATSFIKEDIPPIPL